MILETENIRFDFPSATDLYKFDEKDPNQPHFHGLSHCMKAVDVIAEFPDKYVFIEVKDYRASSKFRRVTQSLINEHLKNLGDILRQKYRDTFLYRYGENKVDKPISYICLITGLDNKLLPHLADYLRPTIPTGIAFRWTKSIVDKVSALDLNTWSRSKYLTENIGTCQELS